jgi:CBS domain-containing protein
MLIGVMQRHQFMEILGLVMKDGASLDKYVNETSVEKFIADNPSTKHFTIVAANVTIERVIELFGNRKLTAVILTEDGTNAGKLRGIITTADIIDLMKILEGY